MAALNLKKTSEILFFVFCTLTGTFGLQCIDEDGNPVDWYVVYKLPKLHDNGMSFGEGHRTGSEGRTPRDDMANGLSYMYLDVNNHTFYLTSKTVNDSSSSFYRTLEPIYNNTDSNLIGYGFYNDETPDDHVSSSHGHTKGAFGFDSKEGFWLIHSVPKFPNLAKNGYSYPHSGATYGQSMLCVTLSLNQFDTVGKHFQYTYPQYYSVSIPDTLQEKVPNLVISAVDNHHVKESPFINTFNITSKGGVTFRLFSKYKKADEDIVSDYMSDQLQSDLYSETWQNGGGDLPSKCSGTYSTWTVKYIDFAINSRLQFTTSKDHSKWAMGAPTSHPSDWVCIGDMNRQSSQETRCGGYACWQNSDVNKQYVAAVTEIQKC